MRRGSGLDELPVDFGASDVSFQSSGTVIDDWDPTRPEHRRGHHRARRNLAVGVGVAAAIVAGIVAIGTRGRDADEAASTTVPPNTIADELPRPTLPAAATTVPVSTWAVTGNSLWPMPEASGTVFIGFQRVDGTGYGVGALDLATGHMRSLVPPRSIEFGNPVGVVDTSFGPQLVTDRHADSAERVFPAGLGEFWIESRIGVQRFAYEPDTWREIELCPGQRLAGVVGPLRRPVVQLADGRWYVCGQFGNLTLIGRSVITAAGSSFVTVDCDERLQCRPAVASFDGSSPTPIGDDPYVGVSLTPSGSAVLVADADGARLVSAGDPQTVTGVPMPLPEEGFAAPELMRGGLWSNDGRYFFDLGDLPSTSLSVLDVEQRRRTVIDLSAAFGPGFDPYLLLGAAE